MQKAFVVYKLSGAGNTFAFVDARKGSAYEAWENQTSEKSSSRDQNRRQLVRQACSPVSGLCCDGFVFLEYNGQDWVWDFYNNDGSYAEMCGNAARCAMLFIRDILDMPVKELVLVTKSGAVVGNDVSLSQNEPNNQFEITMTNKFRILNEFQIKINNRSLQMSLLDTGVPHLVFRGEQLSREESAQLRQDRSLSEAGANVTHYLEIESDHIAAATYERGVEDFTQACGTGAVAAALDYWRQSKSPRSPRWIQVDMPGGTLKVFCSQDEKPKMRGPAEIVLKAKLNKENL